MNWNNLRKNKCPQCDKDFVKGLTTRQSFRDSGEVLVHSCGFQISETKYRKIVSSQTEQMLEKEEEDES